MPEFQEMPNLGHKTFNPMPEDLAYVFSGIEAVGFRHPAQAYYKPDNRGKEYGYFKVTVKDSDNIVVCHHFTPDCGGPECDYCMTFGTIQDFRNWARSNT